jgi:hypothetical protein
MGRPEPVNEVSVPSSDMRPLRPVEINRAQLKVVDLLSAEYPYLPAAAISVTVGASESVAAGALPNVESYTSALLQEARIRLNSGPAPAAVPETSPGTSAPA